MTRKPATEAPPAPAQGQLSLLVPLKEPAPLVPAAPPAPPVAVAPPPPLPAPVPPPAPRVYSVGEILRAASNRPAAPSRCFSCSKASASAPAPASSIAVTDSWNLPRPS